MANADSKPIDTESKEIAPRRRPGRPSKYNAELIARGWNYLETWQASGKSVPTLAGLALALDISEETVQAWQKDKNKSEFSVLCRRLMLEQKDILLNSGLDSTFSAPITKLLLTKHGYSDNPDSNGNKNNGLTIKVERGSVTISTEPAREERVIEHDPD